VALACLSALSLLVLGPGSSAAESGSPATLAAPLRGLIDSLAPDARVRVIVQLRDRFDLDAVRAGGRDVGSRAERRARLVRGLRSQARSSQERLLRLLERRGASDLRSLWIRNALALEAPVDLVRELALAPEVEWVRRDAVVEAPVVTPDEESPVEWNLAMVRAPELWALGHRGQGVLVASMDTGVDVAHPDIATRWRGGDNSWYDPNGEHATPQDVHGHGTQVTGVMLGGDASGTSIGVAPDATWIAVKIFNDEGDAFESRIHLGFQWLLDPDGDPETDDAPDIVNNSWSHGFVGHCNREFEDDLAALRAAGIGVVFAAGNSGPGSGSAKSPSILPGSFAVGAVDEETATASFSGRGPAACNDGVAPRVMAPGVSVRTSTRTLGGTVADPYATTSGTSFAAPHVVGILALLRSAFPALPIESLEMALESTAIDLGAQGPDDETGLGLVDAMAAHSLLAGFDPLPDGGESFAPEIFGEHPGGEAFVHELLASAARSAEVDSVLGTGLTGAALANHVVGALEGPEPDGALVPAASAADALEAQTLTLYFNILVPPSMRTPIDPGWVLNATPVDDLVGGLPLQRVPPAHTKLAELAAAGTRVLDCLRAAANALVATGGAEEPEQAGVLNGVELSVGELVEILAILNASFENGVPSGAVIATP